jgi:HPt (histidine-containing phosphotransfer) domain-containing protein
MDQPSTTKKFLVSELAGEDELAELLALFVQELPKRAEAMRQALATADSERLALLAHQLKGAAGSYGFPTITDLARTVEQAARTGCPPAQLGVHLDELANACARARAKA